MHGLEFMEMNQLVKLQEAMNHILHLTGALANRDYYVFRVFQGRFPSYPPKSYFNFNYPQHCLYIYIYPHTVFRPI